MYKYIVFSLFLVLAMPSHAQMEKIVTNCDTGTCDFWWPVLPAVKGWHHDRESSYLYSANAQAPDGKSFKEADAVIYAKAIYKSRVPQFTTLTALIESDLKRFRSAEPDLTITPSESMATADGQQLKTFDFVPGKNGNWERTAYGQEGDFYILFTLSARQQNSFTTALPAYREFINHYLEKSTITTTTQNTNETTNIGLKLYSLKNLKMIGVMPTKKGTWAILQAPDNLILRVKQGDILGKEGGTVIDINDHAVRIQLPGRILEAPKIITLTVPAPPTTTKP